jgi:hypothetical protein
VVNLRSARKLAKRRNDDARATANRAAYGRPAAQHKAEIAENRKADRDLDGHRIEPEAGK